ncbi:cytochrome c oxidase subunit 6A1, mitochondrial [Lasioglossum baleicum]|uniref:cytochrome c oxidase subunit 6A1, mitochondrial n=1 Tax=Lasioglossum baleicum TaxID=434251 RepID=UPI003FCC5E7A
MSCMSRISKLKLGQFGHTFRRNIVTVETVEQRSHDPGEGAVRLWRNLSLFGAFPAILLAMANCYMNSMNNGHHRPEYLEMPYLKVLRKPFPWGDGKHSLFHNPKTNWIPGVGYEED